MGEDLLVFWKNVVKSLFDSLVCSKFIFNAGLFIRSKRAGRKNKNEFKNIEEIENWLKNNGGYCDCEVLYNVEEMFDEDSIL